MKSIRILWAILLLEGILGFSSCTGNESKKEFTPENLQLTSWKGNVEIKSIGQKMETGIRFNADDTCLLRYIAKVQQPDSGLRNTDALHSSTVLLNRPSMKGHG